MNQGQLTFLRSHFAASCRRRWTIRAACGLLAVLLAVGWLLVPVFLADWTFRFSRGERAALLIGLAAATVWSYARWMHRTLRHRETAVDLALEIERQEGCGVDLVAALQFDAAGAGRCGSAALEQAVIRGVAGMRAWPGVKGDPASRRLRRLTAAALVSLAVLSGFAVFLPAEARAFANRLLLGRARYPTRTTITSVRVNGMTVDPHSGSTQPLRFPYGRAVRFEIECRGALPAEGILRLTALRGDRQAQVVLKPSPDARVFVAELDRLLETVSFVARLGDAESDAETLEPVPFPAVRLELTTTPPDYAASRRRPATSSGEERLSVLEGSRVALRIECANKPLRKAVLRMAEREFPLEPESDARRSWRPAAGETPLARVTEPLQFEIVVTDEDGLSSEAPLRCAIGLELDHPPRVAAGVMTDKVLPVAEPAVSWGATDDYGLAEVRLRWRIARTGGQVDEESLVLEKPLSRRSMPRSLRGRHLFSLSPLNLAQGDEIRLTVEALDDRGEYAGTPATSEPVILHVTDEAGILAALAEADEKSLRELDELIERQLGIGGGP